MPQSNIVDMLTFMNKLVTDELNYNIVELEKTHSDLLWMLTNKHRGDKILEYVLSVSCSLLFLYGFSGTEKTFIKETQSTAFKSKSLYVLNAYFNGISTFFLLGRRIPHLVLTPPIELNELSMLTMTKDSPRAELGCQAKLLIWDEATMIF